MKKVVFIILHYVAINDTLECVDSIRKYCKGENYQIVIVDNASPNKSGTRLLDLYQKDADIDVIVLDENLGFARGNNAGIDHTRKKYNPEFIVLLNNDVLLLQSNTIELIEQEYNNSGFSVLGPMVYTADGRCNDNPGTNTPMTLEGIDRIINATKKDYCLRKWRLGSLYWFCKRLKDKVLRRKKENSHRYYLSKKYNIQLHGCFLCFSREYFKLFNGFYPGTFLYMEEDILFYLTQREHLITVYNPELKIFHKEDSASNAVWKTERKRALNKMYYILESAKELKKLISSDRNRG